MAKRDLRTLIIQDAEKNGRPVKITHEKTIYNIEPKPWDVKLHYDYRFGGIHIIPINPQGQHVTEVIIRLADWLRQAQIPKYELLAYAKAAEGQEEPIGNIDTFRRQAIESCELTGKVVLDIGGYDGAMAKIALDAGAARAICLDNHQYEHYGWEDKKKLEGVEYIKGDLMVFHFNSGPDPETFKSFPALPWPDVIINYNVLYHTKNPWAFLDRCRKIIKPDGIMLLCTLFRYHDGAWMYVYEPRECNSEDETVYFGPSLIALERLLKYTGWDFEQVGMAFDRVVYQCKPTVGWQRKHEDT